MITQERNHERNKIRFVELDDLRGYKIDVGRVHALCINFDNDYQALARAYANDSGKIHRVEIYWDFLNDSGFRSIVVTGGSTNILDDPTPKLGTSSYGALKLEDAAIYVAHQMVALGILDILTTDFGKQ